MDMEYFKTIEQVEKEATVWCETGRQTEREGDTGEVENLKK